jgi:hypothetical protein
MRKPGTIRREKCGHCGVELAGDSQFAFCSRNCANKENGKKLRKYKPEIGECMFCGAPLRVTNRPGHRATGRGSRFCCKAHWYAWRRRGGM